MSSNSDLCPPSHLPVPKIKLKSNLSIYSILSNAMVDCTRNILQRYLKMVLFIFGQCLCVHRDVLLCMEACRTLIAA